MHFFCIRFHRINSPFAGSILTTESVAVYTSTIPSQHNYSIQKFVPKIRCTCTCVGVCESVCVYAPMQFSLLLSLSPLCSHYCLGSHFNFNLIALHALVVFFIYACFICSRFYALFFLFSIGISGDAFLP